MNSKIILSLTAAAPLVMHAQKPINVVIIMDDQHRYDFAGYMGHPIIKTPNLDKLAAEGKAFENAYCVSPISVPSRTSIFTGKYVHRTGKVFNDNQLKENEWTFVEPLKAKGYTIGIAGKNHCFDDAYLAKNFDYWEETGHFGRIHGTITDADKKVNAYLRKDPRPGFEKSKMLLEGLVPGPMPFRQEQCPTYRIAEDGIQFLEQNKEKPFMLYFSFGDPHWPTVVPEPYYSMYNPKDVTMAHPEFDWKGAPFKHFVQTQAVGINNYTDAEKRRVIATYYGQITFVDHAIGMFLNKLKELGLDKNTIVVFMSDHGDWGGNYGIIAKTGGFQETLIRVPMIVKIPGMTDHKHVKAQVSNIDVLPTVFDYLGITFPRNVQGKSFLKVLNGEKSEHRNVIFAEVGDAKTQPPTMDKKTFEEVRKKREKEEGMFWFIDYTTKGRSMMVRRDNWKYVFNTGFVNELYDLKNDPYEMHNLIDNPKYKDKQAALSRELIEWLLREPVTNIEP